MNIQGLCFLHEHNIVHRAYGDPKGVMMDIGRQTAADFDRTQFPVRYYRINFAKAQKLSRGANFYSDVSDCGSMFQALVDSEGVSFSCALTSFFLKLRDLLMQVPRIGGKLRSLVVAMTSGEYTAEGARKLFEALCQGIDASTYDALLQPARH